MSLKDEYVEIMKSWASDEDIQAKNYSNCSVVSVNALGEDGRDYSSIVVFNENGLISLSMSTQLNWEYDELELLKKLNKLNCDYFGVTFVVEELEFNRFVSAKATVFTDRAKDILDNVFELQKVAEESLVPLLTEKQEGTQPQ